MFRSTVILGLLLALMCRESEAAGQPSLPMLHTEGTRWVDASGTEFIGKGCNLGNWLLMEMWMNTNIDTTGVEADCNLDAQWTNRFGAAGNDALRAAFRDNFITERDIRVIKSFDMNVIRVPFWYRVLEDDANPFVLKPDAFKYLDRVIDWAEAHGIYIILDMHGTPGSQSLNFTSGCEGQNELWANQEYLDRTVWLWEQIATYYRGRGAVAAYDVVNEPWGAFPADVRALLFDIHDTIRAVDPDHIVVLPGYPDGFEFYGKPAELGMSNVVHTMHFYPGYFEWGENTIATHTEWLTQDVYHWRDRVQAQGVPLFVGEMNVVSKNAGGGEMMRHSYNTYNSFGWGTMMWSYKVLTFGGGTGSDAWGMVANPHLEGLWIVKADTWTCNNWDTDFASSCVQSQVSYTTPEGTGPLTVYLTLKVGDCCGNTVGVAFDNVSLKDDESGQEMVTNGGFGSASGWSNWSVTGSLNRNFNYTGSTPASGSGPSLLLSGVLFANGGVYQALTLEHGRTYTLSGVFRDVNSTANSVWAEVYLRTDAPVNGQDYMVGPVAGSGISLTNSTLQELTDYFDSLDQMVYAVEEDVKHWLTTTNAPALFALPTNQDWYATSSLDGWATNGTETTEAPHGSDIHRRTVDFGTPPAPAFWKARHIETGEAHPQGPGYDAWVRHPTESVIDLVFDRDAQADDWFPDANLLYQDPVYTASTYVVVGNFQDEIGDPADYYSLSSITVMSDDGSTNGDTLAGDGIYTLTVTIPSPGTYNFTAVLVDRSWDMRITTFGPVRDATGAGEVTFTTSTSNQEVRFLCDIRRNRVKLELGPLTTRAVYVGADGDPFDNPGHWDIAQVPLNMPGTSYHAEIRNASTVPLNALAAISGQVERLTLDPNSCLVIGTNSQLTVLSTALPESELRGIVEAAGANARFESSAGTAMLSGTRLHARSGGVIDIPASSYRIDNIGSAGFTVFSADGAGSLIDLSAVTTVQLAEQSGTGHTLAIDALDGGVIDLSSTTYWTLPAYDDHVAIQASGSGSEIRFGSLGLDSNATLNVTSGAKVEIGNLLDLNDGGHVGIAGSSTVGVGSCLAAAGTGALFVCTDGLLTGSGTITGEVVNAGTYAPGSSIGQQSIHSSFTQQTGAVFELELGGPTDFDRVTVSGDVTVQGSLNVTTLSGYTPQPGALFEFITCGGVRTGTFDQVQLPASPWTNVIEYLSDRIVLRVDSNTDTDGDGMPDWWETLFYGSSTGAVASADDDGDGSNNLDEFTAHTEPNIGTSTFEIDEVTKVVPGPDVRVKVRTEPDRRYRIEFSGDPSGTSWQPFGDTNIPIGTWFETNPVSTTQTFTDDGSAATTGAAGTNGFRRYRITVERP